MEPLELTWPALGSSPFVGHCQDRYGGAGTGSLKISSIAVAYAG